MKSQMSNPMRLDDRVLDRLVDGELDDAERGQALRALDAEPDGWRRCATAFLEAQCWRTALTTESAAESSRTAAAVVRPRWTGFGRLGAIAAAIAVAFLTGFLARGVSGRNDDVARGRPDGQQARAAYASSAAGTQPAPLAPAPDPNASQELLRQPSALPEYVRRQLERQGYEVKGDRKLMSVALKDGRQVTVPVETFKYRFVGYRVY
jgi:hypothetical protein